MRWFVRGYFSRLMLCLFGDRLAVGGSERDQISQNSLVEAISASFS